MKKLIAKMTMILLVGILVVPAIADPNEIKDVNKPILGVYLGESFQKLAERVGKDWKGFPKQPYDRESASIDRTPGEATGVVTHIKHRVEDGCVYIYFAEPFGQRAYLLRKQIISSNAAAAYKTIRQTLKEKYPEAVWEEIIGERLNDFTGAYVGHSPDMFVGVVKIGGVEVYLNLENRYERLNLLLELTYIHGPLAKKTKAEIDRRIEEQKEIQGCKEQKIKDEY